MKCTHQYFRHEFKGKDEALKKVKELDYTPEQLEELIGQINDLEGFVASAEQNVDGAAAAIQAGVQQADELKKNAVRATAPKTESIESKIKWKNSSIHCSHVSGWTRTTNKACY